MERKAELEILIVSLRLQIQESYKSTRGLLINSFLGRYYSIKTLQDQLDKYITELRSLS